jgi:primosomal protein N' (replication factor Y)
MTSRSLKRPLTAQVALPLPLEKTFSYRVPDFLAVSCRTGVRVIVPFGRKKLPGVVVQVGAGEDSALDLRLVEGVLDPSPALDPSLLDFTRWVSEYYFAPWGLVLRAALPAGLKSTTRSKVSLTEEGRQSLENPFALLARGDRCILDLLARKGSLPPGRLTKLARGTRQTALKRLLAAGLVTLLDEPLVVEPAPRKIRWARLGASPAETPRGRSQRRILSVLQFAPEGLPVSEVIRLSGASEASLRSLVRGGRLVLEERAPHASRNPAQAPQSPPDLSPAQHVAVDAILASLRRNEFRTFLLEGVTGAGKTEVYLAAAAEAIARGKGVLYLVPEIGLTPLLARTLFARFPGQVAVLHSALPERERREEWKRIREGRAALVLGTRSALFAPHPALGLVVIDEEQDPSYYQSESPRFNARDAAVVRGQRLGAVVLLGSATPSIEAVAAARKGKFRPLTLPERVEARPMPAIRLVDMRKEFQETGTQRLLSRELADAIRETARTGGQILILLNRRGFATFILCRACGARLNCPHCDIAMTYHREEQVLRCHYCNAGRILPARCPACRSPHLHQGGAGTERLEEAIRIIDPSLRVARLDRDTVKGRGPGAMLEKFGRGEIDLMLGTQMVAKGHDFPGVTLVGILSADAYLGMPDFRAAERTYQLLTQMSGRAGRGSRPGRVLIQAFAPDHPALQAVSRQEPREFYERELRIRKLARYPPWVALTQIRIVDRSRERGERDARGLAEMLRVESSAEYEVLGPSLAPFPRIRGEFRHQILLKGGSRSAIAAGVRRVLSALAKSTGIPRGLAVETDPASLL